MTQIGEIAGWHNISSNENVNVNGITVEDILSILRTIRQNESTIKWETLVENLYKHIINKNNPHELTVDQLKTTVIQVIYQTWLSEGYTGSVDELIAIIFQDIQLATIEDMVEEESLDRVPPVNIFTQAMTAHNEDPNAHYEKINQFFLGDEHVPSPVLSLHQCVGIPNLYADNLSGGYYSGVLFQEGHLVNEFSVCLSFKFEEGIVFQLYGIDNSRIEIVSDTNNNRVIASYYISEETGSDLPLPVEQLLVGGYLEYPYSGQIETEDIQVRVCLTFKKDELTLTGYDRSVDEWIVPGFYITKDIDFSGVSTSVKIPEKAIPPHWPYTRIKKMDQGDMLHDVIVYPKKLTPEQIVYTFEIMD